MIDFIHVGDFKTGTTWFQNYFYPKHPDVKYLGGPFANYALEKYLHELIDCRDLDFNQKYLRENIDKELRKYPREFQIGICREVFSCTNFITGENARRNAERLFSIFGNVKVIFIIREQLSMLLSIYSQYIKMGGTLSLSSFIFDPIVSRGLLERLKWHKQIKMYNEIFGSSNVFVGLYEDFNFNKENFIDSLCVFLEIRKIVLGNEQYIRANKSLTSVGCGFARYSNRLFRSNYNSGVNHHILNKILLAIASKNTTINIDKDTIKRVIPNYGKLDYAERLNYGLNFAAISSLRKIFSSINIGKNIEISQSIKQSIINEFRYSNRILIDEYKLPVKHYGYTS